MQAFFSQYMQKALKRRPGKGYSPGNSDSQIGKAQKRPILTFSGLCMPVHRETP